MKARMSGVVLLAVAVIVMGLLQTGSAHAQALPVEAQPNNAQPMQAQPMNAPQMVVQQQPLNPAVVANPFLAPALNRFFVLVLDPILRPSLLDPGTVLTVQVQF